MKLAIVYFEEKTKNVNKIANGIKEILVSKGHDADIINGNTDIGKKLTQYKFIIVGTHSTSLIGGKIPNSVSRFISSCGLLEGKNCFAFIAKSIMGNRKALLRLMKCLEKEGMLVIASEILSNAKEAGNIINNIDLQ